MGVHAVLLVIATLFVPSAVPAAEQPYPAKPIRLIIPFAPGGGVDIVGRMTALKLSERLGRQVVPENRPGAGGELGHEMVAKSAPDGYTLLVAAAAFSANAALYQLPYDPVKAFVPVAGLGSGPGVLSVHTSVPAKSVKELVSLAKNQPGQVICTTSGVGSFNHLAAELFRSMAAVDLKIVHFKGGGPAMIDQMGGHSHMAISPLISFLPNVKSGKLRALGVGGKKRSAMLPEVPTISEAGLPGYEASTWWGILAPAGTPQAIVDRLYKELGVIVNSEEVKKMFEGQGAEADLMSPAEFGSFIEADTRKWTKVVKEGNIKVEQ
jgi:tripartite-type tricarboxylate transporter receptor subunit TctC